MDHRDDYILSEIYNANLKGYELCVHVRVDGDSDALQDTQGIESGSVVCGMI